MTDRRASFVGSIRRALLAGLLLVLAGGALAIAGTGGFSYDPPAGDSSKRFLDTGPSDLITKSQPGIDLDLAFDDQSADITPQTAAELLKLGKVLTGNDVKGNVYLIAAHTDAREDAEESQALSEQRAAAVKAFLHDRFGIANNRLMTVGYGSSRLKNADDPLAPENNRVEIINLGKKPGAGLNALPAPPPSPAPTR